MAMDNGGDGVDETKVKAEDETTKTDETETKADEKSAEDAVAA